jgi:hypothetical protein
MLWLKQMVVVVVVVLGLAATAMVSAHLLLLARPPQWLVELLHLVVQLLAGWHGCLVSLEHQHPMVVLPYLWCWCDSCHF